MKKLSCRDLGGNCEFTASGETNEDVKRILFDHAAQSHSEMLASLSDTQKQEMELQMDHLLDQANTSSDPHTQNSYETEEI